MSHLQVSKKLWIIFFIALLSLLLAACDTETNPLQTAVNPSLPMNIQTNTVQSAQSSGAWDATTFYATTCSSCHGPTGNGTVIAPALNQENIQSADADWLIETISYGRSGTAMPAWSVESGGSLNSDQIADMAAFLQIGDWETAADIAQQQPGSSMGSGMGGMMNGGMGNGMMGNGHMP